MKLNTYDLKTLAALAEEAARRAGALIASYRGKQIDVRMKEGGDNLASQVVTEVDLKSQNTILEHLENSIKTYSLGLLAEEDRDDGSRLSADAFWCIDPIDGTLPFSEDKPGYAVSIALVGRDGVPLVGVVYDPRSDILYSAVRGEGAFRNGSPWRVKDTVPEGACLTWIMDRDQKSHPRFDDILKKLGLKAEALGLSEPCWYAGGGAVLNALWALEQHPALYFKIPKEQEGGGCFWDFAATACIVSEAGGVVSDYRGEALELNREDSFYMNAKGALYVSSPALAEELTEL